jgi:hypothetical protein
LRELSQQPRLPNARLAGKLERSGSPLQSSERMVDRVEFRGAPDELAG